MHEKSWTVETYKEAGGRVSGKRMQEVGGPPASCPLIPSPLLPREFAVPSTMKRALTITVSAPFLILQTSLKPFFYPAATSSGS
jgi:hypothetical protein